MVTRLLNASPPNEVSSSSTDAPQYDSLVWPRIKLLLDLRTQAIKAEAKQILDLAQSKNLRAHASESYQYGDAVQMYDDVHKTWNGTFKMVFNSGRNCYIERGPKVVKLPTHWIRKLRPSNEQELSTHVRSEPVVSIERGEKKDSRKKNPQIVVPTVDTPEGAPVFSPWKKYHLRSAAHTNFSEHGIVEEVLCGCDFSTIQPIFTMHGVNVEEASNATEDLKQTILDSHGIIDLSRLTPKVYLPLRKGRQALRDEIYGILRQDKNGVPIGELFRKGDAKWKGAHWVMTTVVTKIKTDGTAKCRLCLRGDRIPSVDQPFASAPTASRDFLKIFCGLYVNFKHFLGYKSTYQKHLLNPTCSMIETALQPVCPILLELMDILLMDTSQLQIKRVSSKKG